MKLGVTMHLHILFFLLFNLTRFVITLPILMMMLMLSTVPMKLMMGMLRMI